MAIYIDTAFYSDPSLSWFEILGVPVITPWNALKYNSQASNLALHGTHPFYQHVLINLPQMLGPAMPLLLWHPYLDLALVSAVSGTLCMSLVSHQEARFLLPAIPLLLASIKVPRTYRKYWLWSWGIFNVCLALLMGIYHQAGIIPAQTWLEEQSVVQAADIYWWKTYSPPTWLLNGRIGELNTIDLMGFPASKLQDRVCQVEATGSRRQKLLVAPTSAIFLEQFVGGSEESMRLTQLWHTRTHFNLDDLDFGDDGVFPTLSRVIGKRGLAVWQVECPAKPRTFGIGRDW